jgi:rhomboid protease GluP
MMIRLEQGGVVLTEQSLQLAMWAMAYHLVQMEGFQMVTVEHLDREGTDVAQVEAIHLVRERLRKLQYVKLCAYAPMWSMAVERRKEETGRQLALLMKHTGHKTIDGVQIWFYPDGHPGSEIEDELGSAAAYGKNRSLTMHHLLYDLETGRIQGTHRLKGLNLDVLSEKVQQETTQALNDSALRQAMLHYAEGIQNINEQRRREAKQLFQHSRPFWVYVILAVQLLVFLLMTIDGGSTNIHTLVRFGAKVPQLIDAGEWWRLITPIFIHIGFFHLLVNSFALYSLGMVVEKMFGAARFIWIYLAAGITGNVISYFFSPYLSAGASGALFGLFGALLFFGQHHRTMFARTMGMDILGVLVINLVIGVIVPGIDNFAHLGGLMGGYLAANVVSLPKQKSSFFIRLLGLVIIAGLIARAVM